MIAILCALLAGPRDGVFAAEKQDKILTVSTFQAKAKPPEIHAKGAIAYCGETGEVLYGKDENARLDPLSMTKIMTCYVAMKKIDEGAFDLNTKFTTTRQDTKVIERKLYLQKGEKMPVRDLIYTSLLYSANDAAAVIGSGISGSKEEFAKLMNKEAKALGCTNTNFVNANGLIEKDHYSSPRDMALIAEAAFKYEFLRKVCQTKSKEIPPTNMFEDRIVILTNPFFDKQKKMKKPYKVYNIIGGKTGTWDEENSSLMEASQYGDKIIYTIVMNDPFEYRYKDSVKLIEHGRKVLDEEAAFEEALKEADGSEQETARDTGDKVSEAASGTGETEPAKWRKADAWMTEKFNALMERTMPGAKVSEVDGDKHVTISWKAVDGAEKYRIYRAEGGGEYRLLGSVDAGVQKYRDETSEKDKVYRYYVWASGYGNMPVI